LYFRLARLDLLEATREADVDSETVLGAVALVPHRAPWGGLPKILRNDQELKNHFVRIDLKMDSLKNTRALGALVTLSTGDIRQTRLVRTGSSYLSQNELTLTFGLGNRTSVDEVVVRWPTKDGTRERFRIRAVDRTYELVQGQGERVES
jgi:hypothetical protein